MLADVPCSGLGLLARKPEIRRNMTHERIQGLLPLQAAILDHAAALVRPGGVLVYSTCTFNPAENDGQIDRFLERCGGSFVREDIRPFLPPALLADVETGERASRGSVTLLPHRHGTDGFFIARLRRLTADPASTAPSRAPEIGHCPDQSPETGTIHAPDGGNEP
ncbi:Ribosomal RNA small subunit methyltransferase F [bioreactor metagenome]|uniref:Ribosomal RNA small subunit methyltransferase F n=1 Tax=bioreactor metagenome TaxID=1076179 RepID=A0A645H2T0_9ZZZZ